MSRTGPTEMTEMRSRYGHAVLTSTRATAWFGTPRIDGVSECAHLDQPGASAASWSHVPPARDVDKRPLGARRSAGVRPCRGMVTAGRTSCVG